MVYFGAANNTMYAYDATTGGQKWKYAMGGAPQTPVVNPVTGDICAGASDNAFYCIHANGALDWKFTMSTTPECPAVVSSTGIMYFAGA